MQAAAFVIGPRDGPGAAVRDIAARLGFETVLSFTGLAQAEQQAARTPLLFFLFAAVDDPQTLKPAADAIRFSPGRRLRFSPLIYFSESPSLAAIRQCVGMGFDDVITLPFTDTRVASRSARQIDEPQVYFETASYFGPDRRRMRDDAAHSGRGAGGQHRRIEIVRSVAAGVSVLRDELRAA